MESNKVKKEKTDDIIKEVDNTLKDINNQESLNIFDILNSEEQSEFFKTLNQMYEGIETKTEIPDKELKLIVRYIYYAERVNEYSPETAKKLLKILNEYYHLLISKERKGRKELFETLTLGGQKASEENRSGFFSRLFKI